MRNKFAIVAILTGVTAFLSLIVTLHFGRSIPTSTPVSLPTPTSFPTPSLPPQSLRVVDEIVKKLEWGSVVFNTPTKMKFDEPKIVELVLSPTKSTQELQSELRSLGEIEFARVQISNRMQASLTGENFKVEALVPEKQALSRGKTTRWKWRVTPTEYGVKELNFTLWAIVTVSNQDEPYVIRTYDKTIEVEISLGQRFSKFFSSNWQWLWAAILVPVATFLWKWYQSKQTPKET
jgi:hypothetical protein